MEAGKDSADEVLVALFADRSVTLANLSSEERESL